MYLRYGWQMTGPFQADLVQPTTSFSPAMRQDAKTQSMIEKKELMMIVLRQTAPSDFKVMTEIVVTDPSAVENLRILRLVRDRPSITLYVKVYAKLAEDINCLCERIRQYIKAGFKPYYSFFWGKHHQVASTQPER